MSHDEELELFSKRKDASAEIKKKHHCHCAANSVVKSPEKNDSTYGYEYTYDESRFNLSDKPAEAQVDVLILLEHKETPKILNWFHTKFCEARLDKNIKYVIKFGLACTPENFSSKDIIATYRTCKKFNMKERIQQLNPKVIITSGRALYTITESKDLKYEHFYSLHQDDTWIWSNEFNCKIFPIPALYTWFDTTPDRINGFKPTENPLDVYEKQFTVEQFKKACEAVNEPKARNFTPQFINHKNPNELLRRIIDDKSIKVVAYDTETGGLNYLTDSLYTLQLCYDGKAGHFMYWKDVDKNLIIELFNAGKIMVAHNGQFDMRFLRANGIHNARCDFETMLASHILNENSPNGLKPLTWIYTRFGGYEQKLKNYLKDQKLDSFLELPENILLEYACMDSIITFMLYEYFTARLDEEDEDVKNYYYNYVIPAVQMITDVEFTGIPVDMAYVDSYNALLNRKLKRIHNAIQKKAALLCPDDFKDIEINLNSGLQVSKLFRAYPNFLVARDEDGAPLLTKKGDLVLDKEALLQYGRTGKHKISAAKLLIRQNNISKEISQIGINKYNERVGILLGDIEPNGKKNKKQQAVRKKTDVFDFADDDVMLDSEDSDKVLISIRKVLSKYFDPTTFEDNANDGLLGSIFEQRLHGGFNLHGTETGRMSSSGGLSSSVNLQNMTKRKQFRKIFAPRPGHVFLSGDYQGMEVVQASQMSGPGNLEKVLLEGKDFHCFTGRKIMEIMGRDVTYEEFEHRAKVLKEEEFVKYRNWSKSLNFSCLTGDTLIKTSFGILRIDEVVPEINSGIFTQYIGSLRLLNRNSEERQITHTIFKENQEILDIYLSDASKISITPDHKMIIYKDGEEIKVNAEELTTNDSLVHIHGVILIKSISKREGLHKVYCVNEPIDHEIVLANGVIVGNCLYGSTEYGIANLLGIEVDIAKQFLQAFYEAYPEFKRYMDEFRDHAKDYGYVKNLLGRKRRLPQLTYLTDTSFNKRRKDVGNMLNTAINSPIQGLSGGTTIIAMTNIWKEFNKRNLKTKIIANVHDSILEEVWIPEFDEVVKITEDFMIQPYYENRNCNKARLKVDFQVGTIWDFGTTIEKWKEENKIQPSRKRTHEYFES